MSESNLIITILNMMNTAANIYWGLQLKSVQAGGIITKTLKDQIAAKNKTIDEMQHLARKREAAIDELMKRKNEYKHQFNTQLSLNKVLEGKVAIYERMVGSVPAEGNGASNLPNNY